MVLLSSRVRAGFALPDLLGLLVVLAVAASLALAATRQMRQEAQTASSLSQLRWMAGATSAYAADSGDRFWSFSWKAGPLPHSDPTLPATASSDLAAAAIQATDIMRRLTGRSDIEVAAASIPHVLGNHLPLVDYVGARLPEFNLIAPGDRHRLNWARDPAAFDRVAFVSFQPEPSEAAKRWPYSSSYVAPAAWWDTENRVYQSLSHRGYIIPSGAAFGGAPLHDVAHPSQKVMVHDQEQRELGGGGLYCVDAAARTAMLMGDGSAGVKAAVDANWGWLPSHPSSSGYSRFRYEPSAWEAPVGPTGSLVIGRYRWTRGGIAGRDFGGPDIDTGQL